MLSEDTGNLLMTDLGFQGTLERFEANEEGDQSFRQSREYKRTFGNADL